MKKNTLYQHGTLGSLMAGLMDGTGEVSVIKANGDLGLGTDEGSDGELIFLGDDVFKVEGTGEVKKMSGAEMIPFAAVTQFKCDIDFTIQNQADEEFRTTVSSHLKSKNLFHAVKVHGTFKKMHVRVAPKQTKPYPRFVDIVDNQPEYAATDIQGTILGFFSPELFQGIDAAGYHLHFISDDRTFGGHVLDFVVASATVELGVIDQLLQIFPTTNEDFLKNEIDPADLAADITKAE